MKKAILTLGLFSLVVLTSFTTTETKTQNIVAETGDTGDTGDTGNNSGTSGKTLGSSGSSNRKLDFTFVDKESARNTNVEYGDFNQTLAMRKKTDI